MQLIALLPIRGVAVATGIIVAILPFQTKAQTSANVPTVSVSEVSENEMVERVPISGTLVPRQEVLLYPQVVGFSIEKLHYDIGDYVQAGDILAELDSKTLAARLAQSEAELARAQASVRQASSQINSSEASLQQSNTVLNRAQRLRETGSGTQAALDQAITTQLTAHAAFASATDGLAVARAQLQQAEAQLEIARLNLDYATIVAPVEGLISAREGQVGSIAASGGEPIFRLIANGTIEIEAEVVEAALSSVHSGDEVQLEIAGVGAINGTVRRVSPTVDPVNRLGLIRIGTEENPDLRAGLFAGGWVITDRRVAISAPATAVLSDANGSYVLLVREGGIVEKRSVFPGLLWQKDRELVNGVNVGDMVVSKAGAFFADGDLIRPILTGEGPVSEVAE